MIRKQEEFVFGSKVYPCLVKGVPRLHPPCESVYGVLIGLFKGVRSLLCGVFQCDVGSTLLSDPGLDVLGAQPVEFDVLLPFYQVDAATRDGCRGK